MIHWLATAYHLLTSGQAKVSNCEIKSIIEKMVGSIRKDFSLHLEDVLWAYSLAYEMTIGMSSYRLVFGKPCHLSIDVEHKVFWVVMQCNMNFVECGKHRTLHLQELEEIHNVVYESSRN